MKKMLSVFLVVVLMLSLTVTVFADPDPEPNLIVKNATYDKTYTWYKMFSLREADGVTTYHTTAIDAETAAALNADATCPFVFGESVPGYGLDVKVKEGKEDAVNDWLSENYEAYALAHGDMTISNGMAFATVEPGYYYITTTLGTEVTIDSVSGDDPVVVYDKNGSVPNGPEKLITGEDGVLFEEGKESNEAAVGSVEQFTITFNAVSFVNTAENASEKVLNWVIQDTPEGLAIIEDSIQVYVNDSEEPLGSGAYFKDVDDNGKLTINIPWISTEEATYGNHLYSPLPEDATHDGVHIPVKIVYNATVLAEAATEPAPNAVVVSYGHVPAGTPADNTPNPNNPSDPENPDPNHPWTPADPENPWDPTDPDTPWDPEDPENPDNPPPVTPLNPDDDGDGTPDPVETVTYTYGFDLVKIFAGDTAGTVTGAKFTLKKNGSEDRIHFIETYVDGHYLYRVATQAEIDDDEVATVTEMYLQNSNTAYIRGLDKATYILSEISAPDPYNCSDDITILATDATGDGEKVLTKIETEDTNPEDYELVNKAGTVLPSTGGIGTTIFYVLGTILLLGAGIVLIARRKANER